MHLKLPFMFITTNIMINLQKKKQILLSFQLNIISERPCTGSSRIASQEIH